MKLFEIQDGLGKHVSFGRHVPPRRPSKYDVILHNNDNTPDEAVLVVLRDVFSLNAQQAVAKLMDAHRYGDEVVGTYTKDVAETKVAQAHELLTKLGQRVAQETGEDIDISPEIFTVEPSV